MTSERRLTYRLALRLGYANPDQMLGEMPWRIWQEWQTFYGIEPFDPKRQDYMLATISMLMANSWLRPNRNSRVWTVDDFMPKFTLETTPKKTETEAEKADRLLTFAKDMTVFFGGEFINGNRNQTSTPDSTN